jgi:hypothetical protein
MTNCYQIDSAPACFTPTTGPKQQILAVFQHDNKGQPAVRFVDAAGAIVPGADLTNTVLGHCPLPNVAYLFSRATGAETVSAPFRSVSFTAISNDCEINGMAVPAGFSWSVSAEGAGLVSDDADFTGTDYVLTVVL